MSIAVIIPSDNNFEATLAALQSAVRQSVKPEVVVIVDNDSPDGTFIRLCKLLGADTNTQTCEGIFGGVRTIVSMQQSGPIAMLVNIGGMICDPIADTFGILMPGTQYCADALAAVSGALDRYPSITAVAGDHIINHVQHGLTIASEQCHFAPYDSATPPLLPENMWVRKSAIHSIKRFANPNVPSWHTELYDALSKAGSIYHLPTPLTQSQQEM